MGKIRKLQHQIQWYFQTKRLKNGCLAVVYFSTLHNIQLKIGSSHSWFLYRLTCSRIPNEWSNSRCVFYIDINKTTFENWLLIFMQLRSKSFLFYHHKSDRIIWISNGYCLIDCSSNKFSSTTIYIWNDLWNSAYYCDLILSYCN